MYLLFDFFWGCSTLFPVARVRFIKKIAELYCPKTSPKTRAFPCLCFLSTAVTSDIEFCLFPFYAVLFVNNPFVLLECISPFFPPPLQVCTCFPSFNQKGHTQEGLSRRISPSIFLSTDHVLRMCQRSPPLSLNPAFYRLCSFIPRSNHLSIHLSVCQPVWLSFCLSTLSCVYWLFNLSLPIHWLPFVSKMRP